MVMSFAYLYRIQGPEYYKWVLTSKLLTQIPKSQSMVYPSPNLMMGDVASARTGAKNDGRNPIKQEQTQLAHG